MNKRDIQLALTKAKPIAGHSDYFILDDGTVISTKRKNPIVLSQASQGRYQIIGLVDADGDQRMHLVHDLVLSTFDRPRPSPDSQCRHLNGIATDNRIENLAWGSAKENGQDRVRHGHQRNVYGESNSSSKLTERGVLQILERVDAGERQEDIANDFKISKSMVSKLKRGKAWPHMTRWCGRAA